MNTDRPVVALFDFDGTITTRDSLLPFLWFLYGFWGVCKIALVASPTIVKFIFRRASRQDAKEAILTAAFKGKTPEALTPKAHEYVEGHLITLIKPEAMERIFWHQLQGHRCIVVSASVSLYLQLWVKQWQISDLLCSELALDKDNRYTGKLVGKNCWGPEKVQRIEKLLGNLKNYTLYAYGDSRGDKEMLAVSDKSFYRRWS